MGLEMFSVKDDDDEMRTCLVCKGVVVHPFPCQRGCDENSIRKLLYEFHAYDPIGEAVWRDLLLSGVEVSPVMVYSCVDDLLHYSVPNSSDVWDTPTEEGE